MADEDYSQEGRRLTIHTALDGTEKGDPFLLIQAHGKEYLSRPYQYDLTMLRPKSKGPVFGQDLINTKARFGIRISKSVWREVMTVNGPQWKETGSESSYVWRCGTFKSFAYEGVVSNRFYQYSGVLVPPFKMMDFETCFRVYENKTVLAIIADVLNSFPSVWVDMSQVLGEIFPVMDYCVQFGETTFNFLSRLLAQFGIWYYFEHDPDNSAAKMVLGRSRISFQKCAITEGQIKDLSIDGLVVRKHPSLLTIADFNYFWVPAPRRIRVGDFNQIAPQTSIGGTADIDPSRDLVQPQTSRTKSAKRPPSDEDLFRTEIFPVALASNAAAKTDVDHRMWSAESETTTAKGGTRNPTFFPGHTFRLVEHLPADTRPPGKDDEDTPDMREVHPLRPTQPVQPDQHKNQKYVLSYNEFWCTDNSSLPTPGLWDLLMKRVFGVGTDDQVSAWDLAAGFTTQGLNNYLQNELPYIMQNAWYPQTQNTSAVPGYSPPNPNPANPNVTIPYFLPYAVGGGLAAVTAVLPGIVKALEDKLQGPKDDFHNSFTAIPMEAGALHAPRSVPIPNDGQKRMAYGPHLATVIGPDGAQNANGFEVYADAVGRVRVRFPWQWLGEPTDPWKWSSDLATCWVRVSQAWASHGFGVQFLPRIGDEVVVDFVGGDPDRPIITGRVYNADHGPTNMPFPPADWVKKSLHDVDLPDTKSMILPLSGIETRSTQVPAGESVPKTRYHLVRFDDTYGNEQLLLRSQGRTDDTSKSDRYETTEGNRHVLVASGKDVHDKTQGGSAFMTVGGEYDLHIGKDRYEKVDGGYQLSVKDKTQLELKDDCAAVVEGVLSLSADSIVLQAAQKITLKVGGSTVVVNAGGTWLDGPIVPLQQSGAADSALSVTIKDIADAAKADPGDPAETRKKSSGGKGGPRGQHTVVPPIGVTGRSGNGLLWFDFDDLGADGVPA